LRDTNLKLKEKEYPNYFRYLEGNKALEKSKNEKRLEIKKIGYIVSYFDDVNTKLINVIEYSNSYQQNNLMLKNQEFLQSENYLVNIREHYSALNFMVFATELKLLILKISGRTFLKNFSLRKE
jgi:hypothetical protein